MDNYPTDEDLRAMGLTEREWPMFRLTLAEFMQMEDN